MISAILLSGGIGSRIQSAIPKQYLPLADKPIALYSFDLLASIPLISEIIVVCDSKYFSLFEGGKHANPGNRRQDSLFSGLQKVSENSEYILTHDAVRPFVQKAQIQDVIDAAVQYGSATLATPVKTTIKQANSDLFVTQTLNRSKLYSIQTPQVLKKDILLKGFQKAHQKNITVTDETSLAELIDKPVKLVIGSYENIKITTQEDFIIAEKILQKNASISKI